MSAHVALGRCGLSWCGKIYSWVKWVERSQGTESSCHRCLHADPQFHLAWEAGIKWRRWGGRAEIEGGDIAFFASPIPSMFTPAMQAKFILQLNIKKWK